MRPTSTVAVSSASHACVLGVDARGEARRAAACASARVSSSLAAASAVGHDRAQVAEVEHLEVALGGLGAVAPLGGAHLRHELLGHLQQRAGRDRRLAGGGALGVLLLDGLAHGGQPAEHDLLGDRALLLGQRLEQRVAVGLARRAGAWPWGARRRARAAARGGCGAAGGPCARGARPIAALAVARSRRSPPRPSPSRRGAVAAAAVAATARRGAGRGRSRLRVARVVVTRGSSLAGPSSSSRSGSCRAPLAGSTPVISMPSTKNSASTRSTSPTLARAGEERAGHRALGRLGPGGSPGPGAVVARAGQLDVDPAGHGGAAPVQGPGGRGGRTTVLISSSGGPNRLAGRPASATRRPAGRRRRCRRAWWPRGPPAGPTRVAIHTRWSSTAAPSYTASSGGAPWTSASGPSTARITSATRHLAGGPGQPVAAVGAALAPHDARTGAARRGCSRGTGPGSPGRWRWPRPSSGTLAPVRRRRGRPARRRPAPRSRPWR